MKSPEQKNIKASFPKISQQIISKYKLLEASSKRELEAILTNIIHNEFNLKQAISKVEITNQAFSLIKENEKIIKTKIIEFLYSLDKQIAFNQQGYLKIFRKNNNLEITYLYKTNPNTKSLLTQLLEEKIFIINIDQINFKERNDELITEKTKQIEKLIKNYLEKEELEIILGNYFSNELGLVFKKFTLENSSFENIKENYHNFCKFIAILSTYYNLSNTPAVRNAELILNHKNNFYLALKYNPHIIDPIYTLEDLENQQMNYLKNLEKILHKILKQLGRNPNKPIGEIIEKYSKEIIPINDFNVSFMDIFAYIIYNSDNIENYELLFYFFNKIYSSTNNISLNNLLPERNMKIENFLNSIYEQFILLEKSLQSEKINGN